MSGNNNDNEYYKHLELTKIQLEGYPKLCYEAMVCIANNMQIVKNVESPQSSILERNYIISLVFEMGKLIAKDEIHNNDDLIFNTEKQFIGGETNKYIDVTDNDLQRTCNDLDINIANNKIEVIPDLVVHNSHNPSSGVSGDGQYLIIEAKTTRKLGSYAFMKDFFKLNAYLAGLHFDKAIYLLLNSDARKIDDYLGKYLGENFYLYEYKDKILFFVQEEAQPLPCIYKLKNEYGCQKRN